MESKVVATSPPYFPMAVTIQEEKLEEHLLQIINPLHPKISMHILQTVFYTFPDEEVLLNNQELQNLLIISISS